MEDKELFWQCFLEGFRHSAEGYNAQYPWYKGEERREEMKETIRNETTSREDEREIVLSFEEWYEEHVGEDDA